MRRRRPPVPARQAAEHAARQAAEIAARLAGAARAIDPAAALLPVPDDLWTPALVERAIRDRQPLSNESFDRVYPDAIRDLSSIHWTPIDIAHRAVSLLAVRPRMRLLDIGAGVGKLCIVGALTTTARWTGLERRPDLCAIARRAAATLGAAATTDFRCDDFLTADWSRYHGLYLYNPLGSVFDELPHIDLLTRALVYRQGVALLQAKLLTTRPGTRVVTYHGFGGAMPPGFTRLSSDPAGSDTLDLWVRLGSDHPRPRRDPHDGDAALDGASPDYARAQPR